MSPRKRLYLVTATFLGSAVLLLAGILLMSIHASGWDATVAAWQTVRPAVMAGKIIIMILIVWQWHAIVEWAGDRFGLPREDRRYLRSMRWRLAGAFAALELVLAQNLIGRILAG